MLQSKKGKYAYPYALVSAKTGKLLGKTDYEDLAEFRSVEEILANLEGTDYDPDIRGVVKEEIDVREVEKALMQHFLRIYGEIVSKVPEEDGEIIDRIIREEQLVWNLKIILRGKASGMEKERIKGLIGPGISTDLSSKLIEAEEIPEMTENLKGTPYYSVLKENLEDYEETGLILPLEHALGEELIRRWREIATPEVKDFIGVKTDITNIKILLRCKLMGVPCEEHLIEDGFRLKNVEELKGKDLDELVDALAETPYGKAVKESYEEYERTGSLTKLELKLKDFTFDLLKNYQIFKPLGIDSILFYLFRKEDEVRNLRTIVVCKSYKIEPEEIIKLID